MDKATTLAAPLGRLLLSIIFLLSGFGKLMAPDATTQFMAAHGLPLPYLGYIIALIVELGGGSLILVGYRTRLVALCMAGFCVVTALVFHFQPGDQMQTINFLKNLAMAGGFFQLVAHGAGAWSIDNR